MSFCLGVTFASVLAVIPAQQVTLAWEHSVEKIRWEEDYSVRAGRLELMEARVKGSGAGMEMPEGAVLRDGWWHYRPVGKLPEKVTLTRSSYVKDYELCWEQRCRALAEILGPSVREGETVELFACRSPG
jgi:hypothetical protein